MIKYILFIFVLLSCREKKGENSVDKLGFKLGDTIFVTNTCPIIHDTIYIHDTIFVEKKLKVIPYKIIKHYSGNADPNIFSHTLLSVDSFFSVEKPSQLPIIAPFKETTRIH